MVALSTVVLVSLLAFVTDFGHAYTNKQRMQVGVDAAALAVAQKIALESAWDQHLCRHDGDGGGNAASSRGIPG